MIEGLAPTLAGGLIILVLYRKLRRAVVRQRVRNLGLLLKITLCSTVAILLVGTLVRSNPAYCVAGALGGALGWLAVARMRIEHADGVAYYTPNPVIGLTVFAVFLGRLCYRLFHLGPLLDGGAGAPADLQARLLVGQGTSLTRALLLLLLAYCACFFTGVRVRARRAREGRVRRQRRRSAAAGIVPRSGTSPARSAVSWERLGRSWRTPCGR